MSDFDLLGKGVDHVPARGKSHCVVRQRRHQRPRRYGNKPLYPLHIAYRAPAGFAASAITLLSFPIYALVGARGRLAPALLWLVPAAGAADALLAHKAFGAAAGLEAFLAPCAVLAVLVGRERGVWAGRLMLVLLAAVFLFLHQWRPLPIAALDDEALVHLRDLNLYSVVGLMFFIGWRALGTTSSQPLDT